MDWVLIRQQNQTQINKDNICENENKVDQDYKVGDKFMLANNSAYKYETPHNGTFLITQFWTNGMVTLQCGTTKIRHSICHIKAFTSDTNIEDINI